MVNSEYYLWGAGIYGGRLIDFMKNDLTFKAVIDTNPAKQGTVFHGLPVISYDEAKPDLPKVKVVATKMYPMDIFEFLSAEGFTENRDYFSTNDFIPRYYWDKNKSLVFRTASFGVTTMCNKKCEGCIVFMPIASKRKHMSTKSVMDNLARLFDYVDSVMVLNITVGESLLNNELPDICSYISEEFSERYAELVVQTNSTILPDDEAMMRFSETRTIFVPSNYPESTKNTEKFIEKCNEFDVKWYFNSGGGNRESWFNFGDPRVVNETNSGRLRERFSKCLKPGIGLHNGHLYICTPQTWSHMVAEVGTLEPGDAFDLSKPVTEASREALYRIISRQPPECGYLSHCMRCNSTTSLLKG